MSQSVIKDETDLFISFVRGDEDGFNYFYDKYKEAIYIYALRLLNNDTVEAQDVVIHAFNTLYQNREDIKSPAHMRNYLYLVVRHDSFTILTRLKKKAEVEKTWHKNAASTEDNGGFDYEKVIAEMVHIVGSELSHLPDATQRIFNMCYVERKPLTEIAKELGLDYNSVYRERQAALSKLKFTLLKRGFERAVICVIALLSFLY